MRMLSGERVLTAAHDGMVKMWDVRTDTCVATVGRCSSAVLCIEYDDSTGILAAAGRDTYVNLAYYAYDDYMVEPRMYMMAIRLCLSVVNLLVKSLTLGIF